MQHYIAIQNTYDVFEMALFINGTLTDHIQDDKRHTSKLFIPLFDQLCVRNNIQFSDVSFLAVNCGPGPFSTLRSIIASVNGLHLATNIPLIGIDGLDATFLEFYDSTYANTVVLLNAFNNEIYYLIAHNDQIMTKGYKKIDVFLKDLSFPPARQLTPSSVSFDGDPIEKTCPPPARPACPTKPYESPLKLYAKEGRSREPVEGYPRALEEILQQVQDERGEGQKISDQIHFIGNGVTLHHDLIKQICGNNAVIKENNPAMCSVETIGRLGLDQFLRNQQPTGYLMPLHLKKHAVEL